jgi:hypothetical protein
MLDKVDRVASMRIPNNINRHKKVITIFLNFSPDIYNVSGYLYNYGYEENQ